MHATQPDHRVEELLARIAALEEKVRSYEESDKVRLSADVHEEQPSGPVDHVHDVLFRHGWLLNAVLQSFTAGVLVADKNGRFLLKNKAAEMILGTSLADSPTSEWSSRYGVYQPDRTTLYPTDQLPLVRALRGEVVPETELYLQPEERQEGVWIRVLAQPLRDEGGEVIAGVALFWDVTSEKRARLRTSAEHAVTRVLAEATTLPQATSKIVQAICETADWDVGALWVVERQIGQLRCVDLWHRPDYPVEAFEAVTRNGTFLPGIGLPGRVWTDGTPHWIADVLTDDNFPRAPFAARYGLHGAFAFPIVTGRNVTGVLEFFSRELRKPDEDLSSMISALGSQIGQFMERWRAEEELRKSREQYELAVRGSGDGLWDWQVDTDQVYYSPRWKSMLGYADDEIANRLHEWEERIHPDDRAKAMAMVGDYLAGKIPKYKLEHRLRHKDGTYRWIIARGVALRDENGRPYRMAGSHTDVTDQRQAEEALRDSETLYHNLVETLPLNILRKDLHGRFTLANALFCRTVGRSREEILGKSDFDLFPTHLAQKYRDDDAKVISERAIVNAVEQHKRPDGETIHVQVMKTPVYDAREQVVGTQCIFWDVTDQVRAQETIQKAKEAAESANRAKSVFLANMSHEIRTPMNAIIGMTDLVLDTPLTADQREYLELVQKSAHSLLAVINDILDFSKVEAGRLELDSVPFLLRDHLGDTLNTLAPRAHQKNLELACHVARDVPDGLIGDPIRLNQIIVNLVGNALKFTDQGEVVVDVEESDRDPESVSLHFTISDTGIGVPADKLKLIFDPFAQADGTTTRRYGGTGLGLAIAKRLAEAMGGHIWVESTVGRGSFFHFTGRFGVQVGPIETRDPIAPERVKGTAVLIVDDNATNRRILEETLHNWQMRPVAVASGPQALEALLAAAEAGEPFPLVLIDGHMPGMDGYMLAERIRQHVQLRSAVLMILSSGGQPGDGKRRAALGIAASLTKPVKQTDLWHAIMQALGMPLVHEQESAGPCLEQPPRVRRLRILLAEDNLINQKLAVRLLSRRGHCVTVANNGQEALAHWRTTSFDVILMDVQMPELDGFAATAAIRLDEQNSCRHIPIIAMTAYAMKGDRDRCLEAGMDHYISKPVRAQELFDTVERLAGSVPAVESQLEDSGQDDLVMDMASALDGLGHDRELLRELAELFLSECPKLLLAVRQAMAAGDASRLQAAAHSLKGTVDSFAARPAFRAALRLEMLGRSGNLADMEQAYEVLEREVDRLRTALLPIATRTEC